MYYIRDADAEAPVLAQCYTQQGCDRARKVRYEAELAVAQVYEFNLDPLGLYPEAEARFRRELPNAPFGPNEQAEYIGQLILELGYKAMFVEWRDSWRVDVFTPLLPSQQDDVILFRF
eukprot:gene5675-6860_t